MDKSLIEKYKTDMLNMYRRKNGIAVPASSAETSPKNAPLIPSNVTPDGKGSLIAVVTSLRGLYPVENARVTVFRGTGQNRQIIDTKFTDISGKTDAFVLDAPSKAGSLDQNSTTVPYTLYNMLIEKEGYRDNLHLNIPIFSNTVSLQNSNLMLLETAGVDKSAQIFDEAPVYNL
jgi:hypothetical protein